MLIDFDTYFETGQCPKLRTIYELSSILHYLKHNEGLLSASPLSGGYRNEHYLLSYKDSDPLVLRISHSIAQGKMEITLLQKLSMFLPVPRIINSLETREHCFILMSYLPGEMPHYLSKNQSGEALGQLGESMGRVLGKIHQISFEKAGFFDTQLNIHEPFENQGKYWLNYMHDVLKTPFSKSHLGPNHPALLNLLNQHKARLENLPAQASLVHSDFNLKNLLVKRKEQIWRVSGVLDWEFAHAGSPYVDLGNFFRFDHVLPSALFEGFLKGYQSVKGALPADWRDLAYLFDLASMCNFLESKQDQPKNINTAKQIIEKTLAYFQGA